MPTIEARVTSYTKDGPWSRFGTDHPDVKRLDTKKEPLAQEAIRLMEKGVLARISYTEHASGNINPNTNRPYPPDRYWEHGEEIENGDSQITTAAQTAQAAQQAAQTAPTGAREYGWKTQPDDAWRMALTSGTERAVQTLQHMPENQRSFDVQKRIALAWASFIFFTPKPQSFGDAVAGTNDNPDDIPF